MVHGSRFPVRDRPTIRCSHEFEVCVLGRVSSEGVPPRIVFLPGSQKKKNLRARDTSQQISKRDSLTQQVQVFRKSQVLINGEAIQCERINSCSRCPRYLFRVSVRRSDSTLLARGLTSTKVVIVRSSNKNRCVKAAMRWLRIHCGTGLQMVT